MSNVPRTPGRTDSLYEVLSHPWRRVILRYLQTHSAADPTTVRDLAIVVESGRSRTAPVPPSAGTPGEGASTRASTRQGSELDTVEVALLHTHLPKLAAHGLVKFDAGAGLVGAASYPTEVQDSLRRMSEFTSDLSRYDLQAPDEQK